jgi:hypothetical protein
MSWRTRAIKHREGYWPLNGHAQDLSGRKNHGTLVNTPTWAINHRGKQCIEFDGDDAYANLGDLSYLNAVGAFTIAFWMYQDVIDITDILFKKGIPDTEFFTFSDGNFYFEIIGASGRGYFDYSTIMSSKQWHHVAVIFDGSLTGNAERLKVYIDGKPVTLSFNGTIPVTTSDMSGQDATIGRSVSSFDGKISDFLIYNIPLTNDEIDYIRSHR